jgi:hypothetical protein
MATKISFEGKRELRWLEVGHCLVCYMEAEVELEERLWDDWLEAIRRPSVSGLMICSWGPTQPSHQQWRRATRLMRERQLPVAVVTSARHNFALAKAASWLGTNIHAGHWDQLDEALDFVGFGKDGEGDGLLAKAKIIALRDRFGSVIDDAELGHRVEAPRTPVFTTSTNVVSEANEEIQRKLAEVQARFRARNQAALGVQSHGSD